MYLVFKLFLLFICFLPINDTLIEKCDCIEHNWFYDENGRLVFEQIIFYDWSEKEARYNVKSWRLIKNENINLIPKKDWKNNLYYSEWQDGNYYRKVFSSEIRETFTQFDPELVEREYLPKERRRELQSRKLLYKKTEEKK